MVCWTQNFCCMLADWNCKTEFHLIAGLGKMQGKWHKTRLQLGGMLWELRGTCLRFGRPSILYRMEGYQLRLWRRWSSRILAKQWKLLPRICVEDLAAAFELLLFFYICGSIQEFALNILLPLNCLSSFIFVDEALEEFVFSVYIFWCIQQVGW